MAHAGIYARNRRDLSESQASGKNYDKVLTVSQVKAKLNCSKTQVYDMINAGKLRSFRVGEKKGFRIYESDVEKVMTE